MYQEKEATYGNATGQRVNLDKSSITFGAKVDQLEQGRIKRISGIMKEGGAGSYLGLPECFSGSKIQMLDFINNSLSARFSGWFARSLSLGGKETLLKAVALALPVYAMTYFKIPKTTTKKLTKAMAAFWWNSFEHKKKIHWLSWDRLILSKMQGGLGFRDLQCFNQALLAKQAWRLIQQPEYLFARIFKSRYFPHTHLLQAGFGERPSYAWRSLMHGRELLAKGLRKTIGNGEDTSVWMEKWLFDGNMNSPLMKNPIVDI